MQGVDFEQALEKILRKDKRYRREAYLFVREALDFTQKIVSESNPDRVRHVSGQELLEGVRKFALQQFGPMAMLVLNDWGVKTCEDFGEIVFNMVESGLLAKTEKDSREDFRGGYDFFEALRQPFVPSAARGGLTGLPPDRASKTKPA
jgi:uncharacterized repeat protein (TIGR04138 family)